jgi:hypothetical protein
MEGASASSGSSGTPVLAATIVGFSGESTVAVASAPVNRGKRKISDVNIEVESTSCAKKLASEKSRKAQKTHNMQLQIALIMNQTPDVILNWCTATNNRAVPPTGQDVSLVTILLKLDSTGGRR